MVVAVLMRLYEKSKTYFAKRTPCGVKNSDVWREHAKVLELSAVHSLAGDQPFAAAVPIIAGDIAFVESWPDLGELTRWKVGRRFGKFFYA